MPSVLPAFAFLLLVVAPPLAVTTQMATHIDAVVNDALARQHVAAVSIAIVEKDTVVYAKGYGIRDMATSAKADADTVYPIGSNTKQFTAAAILMLQEQGRLNVVDTLAMYVPDSHAREITIDKFQNKCRAYRTPHADSGLRGTFLTTDDARPSARSNTKCDTRFQARNRLGIFKHQLHAAIDGDRQSVGCVVSDVRRGTSPATVRPCYRGVRYI